MCFSFIVATPLTLNDLVDLQECLNPISAEWVNLANAFRMAQIVDDIRAAPGLVRNRDYLRELLSRWLNRGHPTLETLYQALDQLKRITETIAVDDAITNLKRKFQHPGYVN